MHHFSRWLFAALTLCLLVLPAIAAPGVGAVDAATIAQKDLNDRGLGAQYSIVSLTLERRGVSGNGLHWFARWSEPIPGEEDQKEIGLKINMDGSIARIVQGKKGSGSELFGGVVTRGDRPGIVDLKR